MIADDYRSEQCSLMSLKPDSLLPPDVWQAMRKEAVGHRLALLRRAIGKTPSEMADSLGIERTYWSRFEKGRQGLSDSVAALLTVRYGVTLDFIMLGKWDKLPLDLAEKMRALPPE
ncbi:helix-turn-helix domain-containing protein [Alloyangia pacifica]|uniref:helix-turn-helix domain-containing protein n=1 Tax=Alloyangia pacifica TaxID=311180 RepID=UPI001CFD247F|nr:helix-turn-helix transcriptional regulator [Alloyangia pacifica]